MVESDENDPIVLIQGVKVCSMQAMILTNESSTEQISVKANVKFCALTYFSNVLSSRLHRTSEQLPEGTGAKFHNSWKPVN